MPFTISHVAVVLPFSRVLDRWRLLSATVIGAMVPDFGLFFPWRLDRGETHSRLALLTFCLPVGLIVYWFFQYAIKTPVLEVLPNGAYARSRPHAAAADIRSIRQWLVSALAILAGAVTHLVWDAFTHEGARGVRMIPWIDEPVAEFGSHRLMGVRLLQDGTSLVGLTVVFVFICYALRRGRLEASPARILRASERHAWALAYLGTALVAGASCFLWARYGDPYRHFIGMMINGGAIAALRGIALSLVGVSLLLGAHLRALRR